LEVGQPNQVNYVGRGNVNRGRTLKMSSTKLMAKA